MPSWAEGDGWVTLTISHSALSELGYWGWSRIQIASEAACDGSACEWGTISFGSGDEPAGREPDSLMAFGGEDVLHVNSSARGMVRDLAFPLYPGKSFQVIEEGENRTTYTNITVADWMGIAGYSQQWRALEIESLPVSYDDSINFTTAGKRWLRPDGMEVRWEDFIKMDLGDASFWLNRTRLLFADTLPHLKATTFASAGNEAMTRFDIAQDDTLFILEDWSSERINAQEAREQLAELSESVAVAGANISAALVTGEALRAQEDLERAGSALLAFLLAVGDCVERPLSCDEDEHVGALDDYETWRSRAETRLGRI